MIHRSSQTHEVTTKRGDYVENTGSRTVVDNAIIQTKCETLSKSHKWTSFFFIAIRYLNIKTYLVGELYNYGASRYNTQNN